MASLGPVASLGAVAGGSATVGSSVVGRAATGGGLGSRALGPHPRSSPRCGQPPVPAGPARPPRPHGARAREMSHEPPAFGWGRRWPCRRVCVAPRTATLGATPETTSRGHAPRPSDETRPRRGAAVSAEPAETTTPTTGTAADAAATARLASSGEPRPADGRTRVVVVGGGFGGLAAVRELSKVASEHPLHVTLVDKRNHHTFQPLLYQLATAGLQPHDIGMSLRSIHGVRRRDAQGRHTTDVRLGEVVAVDDEVVTLADGGQLPYDRLVLAAGGITNDLGIPGVAEHAFGLKSIPEATQLRNHLLRRFEAASADPRRLADGTLTFVIAGGGPTGVELAGAVAELVEHVLQEDHPTIDFAHVRIVLLELTDRLLPGFHETSHRAALRGLQRRGVEVRLGVGADEVTADHIVLSDGEVIPARTLIWATGIAAVPLAGRLGAEQGRAGRVNVDERLRVPGRDGRVFVIGDLAGDIGGGDPLPQVAPVAIQQGRYVADVLRAELAGEVTPPPFRYRDKGKMATIGRASAVVELPFGLRFRGVVAWLVWLLAHLLWLVGFKNRVSVLVSWAWNYLTYDHAARLLIEQREAEEADTSKGRVRRSWADRDDERDGPAA
ncbi:NAD(P)/FAD-dependent oxidoreductase [Nitriliruptoraceae bacterium ZYF776]|nr:NAD(P)/FAD-dependent oxidoreductase [Profundirhabdus halotolerans]